jgi:multidrug efflux pump subunit AcrB
MQGGASGRLPPGTEVQEAAREAARPRFRPILMTSFAFILGSLPLVFASGAPRRVGTRWVKVSAFGRPPPD